MEFIDFGNFHGESMYVDTINGYKFFLRNYILKIKVALKIKIYMWFFYWKVILMNGNLAKRNLNNCKKYAKKKTSNIKHC
jgi:hypothetical protein